MKTMQENTITRCQRLMRWLLPIAMLISAPAFAEVPASAAPYAATSAVTINGIRNFNVTAGTSITLDGNSMTAGQFAAGGRGFNALVHIANVDPITTSGDATQIDLRNLLKGPVTSVDPLKVLNQPITVTADTLLVDVPGNDPAQLSVGSMLEVSGFMDTSNTIIAARVQFHANPLNDWKLSGYVAGLNGTMLAIGSQSVDFTGVTPLNCTPPLANGSFVEIEAFANAGYTAASVLSQVFKLECEDPNFSNPPPGTTQVSLEGLITAVPNPIPSPATFSMSSVEVVTTAQTEYRGGTADDLAVGVRVESEGFYDAATHLLTAREVHFTEAQVRFEAPVAPAAVTPGESITIMDNLVQFTAQTRDEDGIAALGLGSTRQVEVRGLVDSEGNLFATRIRDRGNADINDTRLRGPVSAIAQPELTILGNTINTSSAVFLDHDNQPISAAQFFAQVQIGTIVSAEDATYNAATHHLIAGKMELEEDGIVSPTAQTEAPNVGNGLSRGTITGFGPDKIFANGFN